MDGKKRDMAEGARSLMDFVGAPVVVGDPDGRAVYINPAFESHFGISRVAATGQPLASLFEGGGREAVLRAVAEVCAGGETVRIYLKENEVRYMATASPIVAEQGRVGVVILLTSEPVWFQLTVSLLAQTETVMALVGFTLGATMWSFVPSN